MLVERVTDMRPIESSIELPFMGKASYKSNFERKMVMQTEQLERVNAVSKVHF